MIAIEAVTTTGARALCQSVGLARATLYRRRQPARSSTPTPRQAASSRALGPATVLDVLHSERFVDQSPAEVQATLTDVSLLHAHDVSHSRRRGGSPGAARPGAASGVAKPELVATAPNQIWSWDITKLKGPISLPRITHVILDLFSRYVVGWMVASRTRTTTGPAPDRGDVPHRNTSVPGNSRSTRTAARRCAEIVALLFSDSASGEPVAARVTQRQSGGRSPIPDGQIPPGLSGDASVPS